jgi:hypothetical protein
MSEMSDQDRILAMLEGGKITAEEAKKLLNALHDLEGISPENVVTVEAQPRPVQSDESAADERAAPIPPQVTEGQWPWVVVDTFVGDLVIKADAAISEPVVDNHDDVTFVQEGENYRLNFPSDFGELQGFLDNFISRVRRANLTIRVPENYGVDLHLKAGDVTLLNVPYLKGVVMAGDVEASNLRAIDFTMRAGDFDASLLLTDGVHAVTSSAGDLSITLLPGSSVTIDGDVNIGDASYPKSFSRKKRMVGQAFHGQIGDGEARLNINLSAGDISVRSGED